MCEADCAKAPQRVGMNQKVNEAYQPDPEAVQPQNDDNQPNLLDRISQFFRSVWNRLSCCKNPTNEKFYSLTRSEDKVEENIRMTNFNMMSRSFTSIQQPVQWSIQRNEVVVGDPSEEIIPL